MGNRPTIDAVADIVYRGIIEVLKALDGDRFVVVGEHSSENPIFDTKFLGFDELKAKLNVRPGDIMIDLVFVKREDLVVRCWSAVDLTV
jgi:hypothetical protein